jgi:hypothetical protein
MKISRIRNPDPQKRGIALAVMVFAVVGLAALSASLMFVNLRRTSEQRDQQEQISADYICQAGLSQAMYQVRRGQSGNVGTAGQPTPWGEAQFWVEQVDVTPTIFRLTATGFEDRAGARQELTMR